ncbi:MAG: aminotransferase class V-fold PLP-dependent enzyme [Rhodoferax sp.]|nr:aminotransferase class V-fold PLP-dependent enzyme [Rhodoferax sp.]MCF8211210.1 aminotransferase class V-fold PLP-dependent enzyme [Rhodoferax sp.]
MNVPSQFLTLHPAYLATGALDELRAAQFGRLDAQDQVYLDYTGGGLHAASQVQAHAQLLSDHVLGNPHSVSPSSMEMTRRVEQARAAVLEYFHGTGEYTAIFTLNASGALKLVGESYPFAPGGQFLLTADNHNSVNGIREFAEAKGATVTYAPMTRPELRIDQVAMDTLLATGGPTQANLLAFPAQSNFSGVKHPLELVAQAQAKGWHVLLDAAAFVPTNLLDLRVVRPDFVALSFYKMFGYPTGVGCLLVRKPALSVLRRPWFGGGTVNFATVQGRMHVLSQGEAAFEDGTLNYLGIPAVEIGLRHLQAVGIETIQTRVYCLTEWLITELLALQHSNGRPMVRLYGPANMHMRGGTVTLNLYDPNGHLVDYRRVEELAGEAHISLRTGCFCNPGAGETAEDLNEDDMRAGIAQVGSEINLLRFSQAMQARGGKSAGAIRVSTGIASNFADVERFLHFVVGLRDQTALTIGSVSFDIESCRVVRDGG